MAITRLNSRLIPYASIGVAASRTRDNRPGRFEKREERKGRGERFDETSICKALRKRETRSKLKH